MLVPKPKLADAPSIMLVPNPVVSEYLNENDLDLAEDGDEDEDSMDLRPDELELLARLIYAEARGESLVGQIAVGSVVMNRVKSPNFPGDVESVIYQPRQFCPVSRGSFSRTSKFNEDNHEAASRAVAGEDPTNGALYFYHRTLVQDTWIQSREVVADIGVHRFTK